MWGGIVEPLSKYLIFGRVAVTGHEYFESRLSDSDPPCSPIFYIPPLHIKKSTVQCI